MGNKKGIFGRKKTGSAERSVEKLRARGAKAVSKVEKSVRKSSAVIDVKFAKDSSTDDHLVVVRTNPGQILDVKLPSKVEGFEVRVQEVKPTPTSTSDDLTISQARNKLEEELEGIAKIETGFGYLTVVSEEKIEVPKSIGRFEVRTRVKNQTDPFPVVKDKVDNAGEDSESTEKEAAPEEEDGSTKKRDGSQTDESVPEKEDDPCEKSDGEAAKETSPEKESELSKDEGANRTDDLEPDVAAISDDVIKALRAEAEERLSYARAEADKAESLKSLNEAQREDIENQLKAAEEMRSSAKRMEEDSRSKLREIERIKKEISVSHEKAALDQAQLEIEKVKSQDLAERAKREADEAKQKLEEAKRRRREVEVDEKRASRRSVELDEKAVELNRREAQVAAKERDIDELHEQAREDRRMSAETLRSLKGHRIDAARIADAAEVHLEEMEKSRAEAKNREKELELKIEEQADITKRAKRTLALNENEAKMLDEFKQKVDEKAVKVDERASEAELLARKADLETSELRKELQDVKDKLASTESEREAAIRRAETLEVESEQVNLLRQETEELRAQLDARGPTLSDTELVEQGKALSRRLADAIRSSDGVMEDQAMKGRCQGALKELVRVCEGAPAEKVMFESVESLIDEINAR